MTNKTLDNNQIKPILRSLLQKAVRRGNKELIERIIKYLFSIQDHDWLRKRLGVMVFEESWAYANKLNFENKEEYILNQYLSLSETIKNKDVAGLGLFAYNYSEGITKNLNYIDKEKLKYIKHISQGIKRPVDFWNWVKDESKNDFDKSIFIEKSHQAFKKASWAWDKAFIISGAYLAIVEGLPEVKISNLIIDCPYWLGIDKHTEIGRNYLKVLSNKNNINIDIVYTLSFYLEGAICNEIEPSYWWTKEIELILNNINMSFKDAQILWNKLKIDFVNSLQGQLKSIDENLNIISKINIDTLEQMELF